MDERGAVIPDKEVKYFRRLKIFAENLANKQPTELISYLKRVTLREIKFITEICINFLKGNISSAYALVDRLKNIKRVIYKLASPKTSIIEKRRIISSLKGVHILKQLAPVILKKLTGI